METRFGSDLRFEDCCSWVERVKFLSVTRPPVQGYDVTDDPHGPMRRVKTICIHD